MVSKLILYSNQARIDENESLLILKQNLHIETTIIKETVKLTFELKIKPNGNEILRTERALSIAILVLPLKFKIHLKVKLKKVQYYSHLMCNWAFMNIKLGESIVKRYIKLLPKFCNWMNSTAKAALKEVS